MCIQLSIFPPEGFSTISGSHISLSHTRFNICTLAGGDKTDLYTKSLVLMTTAINVSEHLLRRKDWCREEGRAEGGGWLSTLETFSVFLANRPLFCPHITYASSRAHRRPETKKHSQLKLFSHAACVGITGSPIVLPSLNNSLGRIFMWLNYSQQNVPIRASAVLKFSELFIHNY